MRLLVGVMLAIGVALTVARPATGVVFLVIWVVMGGLLLLGDWRTRVIASEEGITAVPFFGRKKRYAWSEINGFTVERISGARYGGPAVAMSVTDRNVMLKPTMRRDGARAAVQRTCDALNAHLERYRRQTV